MEENKLTTSTKAPERKKPKTVKNYVVYLISSSVIAFFFLLEFLTGHHNSEEGGSVSEIIPISPDQGGLATFVVGLYNSNKVLFALGVTVSMAIMGLLIAFTTEFILRLLGLKVSKISHHE